MLCRKASRCIAQTLLLVVGTTGSLGQGLHLLTGVHAWSHGHATCSPGGHHCSAHAQVRNEAHHERDHHERDHHERQATPGTRSLAAHPEETGIRGTHECLICQLLALAALNGWSTPELPYRGGIWQRSASQIELPDAQAILAYSGRAPPTAA